MIRVSIVEDDHATREGLVKLLEQAPEIACVGVYESAEKAEREIPKHLPDVVLMDINLPGRSGVECVAKLKRNHPQLQFVMLTTYDANKVIFNALRAGASGYLLKRAVPDELLMAINEVHAGGAPMSMQIARKVILHFHQEQKHVDELGSLTRREQEILELLSRGLAYKQIAEQLFISRSTVHRHLHAVYAKLHVQSGKEAVVKFLNT